MHYIYTLFLYSHDIFQVNYLMNSLVIVSPGSKSLINKIVMISSTNSQEYVLKLGSFS